MQQVRSVGRIVIRRFRRDGGLRFRLQSAPGADHSAEDEIVKYLRTEAYQVRDCFTRFSIQVLAAVGALLTLIARFQLDAPYVGVAAFFLILLLSQVSGMGLHKYETSNRLLGYELHLQRIAHYKNSDQFNELIRKVGWEEGMRAWRVIQPTMWEAIYRPAGPFSRALSVIDSRLARYGIELKLARRFSAIRLSDEFADKTGGINDTAAAGLWFDQSRTIESLKFKKVVYFAGGYLRNMLYSLLIAAVMCLIPPFVFVLFEWHSCFLDMTLQAFTLSFFVTVFFVFSVFIVVGAHISLFSRVRLLESGLLSIHSCAILWEATLLAHLRALRTLGFYSDGEGPKSMHGYTNQISQQAELLIFDVVNVHKWIEVARKEIEKELQFRT